MSAQPLSLLIEKLRSGSGNTLVALDENISATELAQLKSVAQTVLITNRYDIWQYAERLGLDCQFSDFDFSSYQVNSFSRLAFRVAKEKALTHYIINQSARLLRPGGELLLVGAKNEGIKSYAKNAGRLLQNPAPLQKSGIYYTAVLTKAQPPAENFLSDRLDDSDYPRLRPAIALNEITLYSKPGIFGWNKIDQGSLLLVQQLPEFFSEFSQAPTTILDIGCGYGLLSLMASRICNAHFIATDNNAAALAACTKNFSEFNVAGEVIGDNCATGIETTFDAVLCHPPFHRGFDTERELTEQFLHAAAIHLRPGGKALFVANQFVPLEKLGGNFFNSATRLVEDHGFKVVMFSKINGVRR